jgi:hypothetical protein
VRCLSSCDDAALLLLEVGTETQTGGVEVIVESAFDKVQMGEETQEHFKRVFEFAAKKPETRLRSFLYSFEYALNWGKGERCDKPTVVMICPDFAPYSFIFNIWCFRYDEKAGVLTKDDRPFTMGLIYDASRDVWSTHS